MTGCQPSRLAFSLFFAFSAIGAHAGTNLYVDPTAFANAVASSGASLVTGDLAAAAAANGVTDTNPYGVFDSQSITVGSTSFAGTAPGNAAGFLIQNTYGIAGAFYSHQMFNGTDNAVTVTFASPVKAFSFSSNVSNVTINGPAGALPMTLTTSSGEVFQTVSTPLYWGGVDLGTAPLAFNGLVSDLAFNTVTISAATQGLQITGFATAPVPESSTMALMMAGLLGLGVVASRRRGV